MHVTSPFTSFAIPPVATTVSFPNPVSDFILSMIFSTSPAMPNTMPACMAFSVFLPSTLLGASSSIMGSCAVPVTRLASAVFIPGAMITPMSSPFAETTSNVVAVPKSITTTGPPYFL